jgi:flagellar basal-body rod protein FlgB
MALAPVHDSTTTALQLALKGLGARQRAVAKNVANLETPGYVATAVSFEDSLREAIAGGSPASAAVTEDKTSDAAGPNGNNVLLDHESMVLADTGLRYQLLSQAVSLRFGILRAAIGRG